MAQTGRIKHDIGGISIMEIGGTLTSNADAQHVVLTADVTDFQPGFFYVEATLIGYTTVGDTLTGTVDASVANGTAVDGTTTDFKPEVDPGDTIRLDNARTVTVDTRTNDILLDLDTTWTGADLTGVNFTKIWKTFARYTGWYQWDDLQSLPVELAGRTLTHALNEAGSLLMFPQGGPPSLAMLVDTSVQATSHASSNTLTTNWNAWLKIQAMTPQYA